MTSSTRYQRLLPALLALASITVGSAGCTYGLEIDNLGDGSGTIELIDPVFGVQDRCDVGPDSQCSMSLTESLGNRIELRAVASPCSRFDKWTDDEGDHYDNLIEVFRPGPEHDGPRTFRDLPSVTFMSTCD